MAVREYQSDHIQRTVDALHSYRKVCVQLPTGGGKTYEFALITQQFIRGYIRDNAQSVLILVHRKELLKQAAKTIKNLLDIDASLITSETKHFRIARVYIGMVESTIQRLDLMQNVGLVIIDECHINSFNKIHNVFLDELILGYSATPISASKKEPLNKYYQTIVTGPQIKELINLGYLAQNITRCPKDVVDASKFALDKMKGDYNERQMSDEYRVPKHVANVVKSYRRLCKGQKVLIFNVSIEHSKEVNEVFQDCGYNSRHLDSNCSDEERDATLQWYKTTPDAILNNVMITTVGFDEPTVQTVILNFSTLSLPKLIQTCGRGSRIIDEEFIENYQIDYPYELQLKRHFNIIDMGGNCIKFNTDWNDDRDWDYIFNHPDSATQGSAPVKTCPDCDGLVYASCKTCTLENEDGSLCLHEFVTKRTVKEQDLEEMILITKGIDVNSLIQSHKKKHDYFTFLEIGSDIVSNMIAVSGNSPSETVMSRSFRAYYKVCCEWYANKFAGQEGYLDGIEDSGWHIRLAKNNFNKLIEKFCTKETITQDWSYTWNKEIPTKKELEEQENHFQKAVKQLHMKDFATAYGR